MVRRETVIREILATSLGMAAAVVPAILLLGVTLFIENRVMQVEHDGGMAIGPVIALLYGLVFALPAAIWSFLVRITAWKFQWNRKVEGTAGLLSYAGGWLVFYALVSNSLWNTLEPLMNIITFGVTFVAFWLVQRIVLEMYRWRDESSIRWTG